VKPTATGTAEARRDPLTPGDLLYPDERILWRGRPVPRAAIRGRILLNITVSLPFLAVVALMAARVGFGTQTAIYAVLFGLGLWQLARPLRFYRQATRTLYAVTDQRVLIVTLDEPLDVHAVGPEQVREVLLHRFRDGKGHVYLVMSRVGRLQVRYDRVGYLDGFWGIEDPQGAADAVRTLQASRLG